MSDKQEGRNGDRDRCMAIGPAIGMSSFAFDGFVLRIATGNPAFLGLGPALGVALGFAIGEGLYRRTRQRGGKEQ